MMPVVRLGGLTRALFSGRIERAVLGGP